MPSRAVALVVGAILTIALVACETDSLRDADEIEQALARAEVVRVVDGDTVIVRLDGREERLRYIGIDAPESVTPDQPVDCFGTEASDENRRLVAGQTVFLEADREDRDRFGRLLRYVYVEGPGGDLLMVNRLLVEHGFVEAGSFPPNDRYRDDLFEAERLAQADSLGLWGVCR